MSWQIPDPCTTSEHAHIWLAYQALERHHTEGGLSLFEALATHLARPVEHVIDSVVHCWTCQRKQACQHALLTCIEPI